MTDSAGKSDQQGARGRGRKRRHDPTDLRPIRRLLPYVLRYRWRVLVTILLLLVSSLSSLGIPAIAGNIVDKGFLNQNLMVVTQFGALALVLAFVMSRASAGRFYFISLLGERVLTDLRRSVFEHLLRLDSVFFDTHRVGELTSRLNGDVATIRGAIGSTLSMVLRHLGTVIGALSLLFLTSPYMTITIALIGPAVVVPVVLYARRLRRQSRQTTDTMAEMSALATQVLRAPRTIKSFVQEPIQSQQYGKRAEKAYRSEVNRLVTRAVLLASMSFLSTAAVVVLAWWGSKAVFDR